MNSDIAKKIDYISEQDMLCDVCIYRSEGCTGEVRGGPNGPIYPPCADDDTDRYVDTSLLEKVYAEVMEDDIDEND